MISYARNAEDVVLARALSDAERGFYIDVGPVSPIRNTVTRHFYDAGWTGVNVVALPERVAEFRQERTRDVNLELSVGSRASERTLYRVPADPARSTFSGDIAAGYARAGLRVEKLPIAISTLSSVLESVAPERIDFLAIGPEASEGEVLAGVDFERWRPRVIVIASDALGPAETKIDHGSLLKKARYKFASTDGVNRFYVRNEESALLAPRLVPANSGDDYQSFDQRLLEDEISRLRVTIRHLEHDLELAKNTNAPEDRQTEHLDSATARSPLPLATSRVIDLERIAICTSPQTSGARLADRIAGAISGRGIASNHPADVDWQELPERCVLTLSWARTEKLRVLLATNGFRVVTVARHPLDTLLAILRLAQVDREIGRFIEGIEGHDDTLWHRDPTSEAFLSWAAGPRGSAMLDISSSWAEDPAVLKVDYERLSANPAAEVRHLLELGGIFVNDEDIADDGAAFNLESLEGDWRNYLSTAALDRLLPTVVPRLRPLGFGEPNNVDLPREADAQANWQKLLNASHRT